MRADDKEDAVEVEDDNDDDNLDGGDAIMPQIDCASVYRQFHYTLWHCAVENRKAYSHKGLQTMIPVAPFTNMD